MEKVTINFQGKAIDLPCYIPTIGPSCVDVTHFASESGAFTYDPGFMSTAACKSKITYIDGDAGKLWYAGYPIEDVATNLNYIETFYLLFFGNRPSISEKIAFEAEIMENFIVPQIVIDVISKLPRRSHPMALLSVAVSTLAGDYESEWNGSKNELYKPYLMRLFSQFIASASFIFRYISNLDFVPSQSQNFIENFCETVFAGSDIAKHKDPLFRAINRLLILHADHEQNASTSAVRVVMSTDVNPYGAVLSGVSALWGPLHGGANEAVLLMLNCIGKPSNIAEYIEGVKAKKMKLMGFGHRVYKNYDPRAAIIKSSCDEILALNKSTHLADLLKTAQNLESIALHDEYFTSRKLFPNVDFYSGIIYSALGIPVPFFTVMFAIGRVAGWCAHINEFLMDDERKIARPRQLYLGEGERHF